MILPNFDFDLKRMYTALFDQKNSLNLTKLLLVPAHVPVPVLWWQGEWWVMASLTRDLVGALK